jgi:hypothetical protein
MENKVCPSVFVQCFLVVSKLFLVEKDWRIKIYYKLSKIIEIKECIMEFG